ncbi:MAG TPA: hypothetical protein VI757_16395 [Bacteroidia bacterium]|nr:hypothetical protein [Bacteroidia bacterium]
MAAHYLMDVLDPEQMAKEWNELPSRADEIKKRFAAMAKYFMTIESDFTLLETRVEQWNAWEKDNKNDEQSEGRVIPFSPEKKKAKPAQEETKKEQDNEPVIKAMDELTVPYLIEYITGVMRYIAAVRKGFVNHRTTVSTDLDELIDKQRYGIMTEMYGILTVFKRDWNNPERLGYFRKGKELFINSLDSFSKALDSEQNVYDAYYNTMVPRMEQFEGVSTMVNGLYTAADKYMRQLIANPEKFEESEIEDLLGTLIRIVNLLAGYRWHVQELNAIALNILFFHARELNLLSRMHTAHAIALEYILKDENK